jgi:hypothetical protein
MTDGLPTFEATPLVERTVEQDLSLSTAVIEAVASVSNVRIEDLPPLYDALDPEILDTAFARSGTGLIAFQYNGCLVSVTGDRTVAVYER